MRTREDHRKTWMHGALAGAALAAAVAGCTTTQQVKVSEMKASEGPPTYCPFLGPELCAKLTPTETPGRFSVGGEPVMGLRYMNPDARWKNNGRTAATRLDGVPPPLNRAVRRLELLSLPSRAHNCSRS